MLLQTLPRLAILLIKILTICSRCCTQAKAIISLSICPFSLHCPVCSTKPSYVSNYLLSTVHLQFKVENFASIFFQRRISARHTRKLLNKLPSFCFIISIVHSHLHLRLTDVSDNYYFQRTLNSFRGSILTLLRESERTKTCMVWIIHFRGFMRTVLQVTSLLAAILQQKSSRVIYSISFVLI